MPSDNKAQSSNNFKRFVNFWTHKHGREELVVKDVRPEDITEFFDHRRQTSKDGNLRKTTIEQYKSDISVGLDVGQVPWNNVDVCGNPTQSSKVHKYLAELQTAEVHGVGKASKAKRELKYNEFREMLLVNASKEEIEETGGNVERIMSWESSCATRVALHAFWTMQWHLMGRTDDIFRLNMGDVTSNPYFDFALNVTISKSKTVSGLTSLPQAQFILPGADPVVCSIFALARYLAHLLEGKEELELKALTNALDFTERNGETRRYLWVKHARIESHVFEKMEKGEATKRMRTIMSSNIFKDRSVSHYYSVTVI